MISNAVSDKMIAQAKRIEELERKLTDAHGVVNNLSILLNRLLSATLPFTTFFNNRKGDIFVCGNYADDLKEIDFVTLDTTVRQVETSVCNQSSP